MALRDTAPVSRRFAKSDPHHPLPSEGRHLSEGLEQGLDRRYGRAAVEPEAGFDERTAKAAIDRLLAHRSVRRYRQKELEPGTLELLVAAAQSAASSSNLQLWSVVNVTDPELRRSLSLVAGDQEHVRQAPLFLVWVADLHRAAELARSRGLPIEGLDYLESFLVASVDAALAAQNAVVAAEALGLGTVYIGALRNHPARVSELLGLPKRAFFCRVRAMRRMARCLRCLSRQTPLTAGRGIAPRSLCFRRARAGTDRRLRPADARLLHLAADAGAGGRLVLAHRSALRHGSRSQWAASVAGSAGSARLRAPMICVAETQSTKEH